MTLNLDDIRGRLEKASPGPWTIEEGRVRGPLRNHPQDKDLGIKTAPIRKTIYNFGYHASRDDEDNAEFIAHARQDISDLLAEVERLQKELNVIRSANTRMAKEGAILSEISEDCEWVGPQYQEQPMCNLCDGMRPIGEGLEIEGHKPDCPYTKLKKLREEE